MPKYVPVSERFWNLTKPAEDSDCILWTGSISRLGYGRVGLGRKTVPVHRVAYMIAFDEIPEGLVIDHLCRTRNCVNAQHLEAVTQLENVRRGAAVAATKARFARQTHCINGHEFNEANTHIRKNGTRACRGCNKQRASRRRAESRKSL